MRTRICGLIKSGVLPAIDDTSCLFSFDGRQLDEIFMSFQQTGTQGLIIASDTSFFRLRSRIVRLAARHRIPAIYSQREFAEAGGLITYGVNVAHASRLAGVYTANIVKGEPLS